jgi:hypothetical protein
MRQADVQALVRRFLSEVLAEGSDPKGMLSPRFFDHTATPAVSRSNGHVLDSLSTLRRAVSDLQIAIDDIVVVGDTAVVRWSAVGTLHLWMLPPMDLVVDDMTHVFRVEHGVITDVWSLDAHRREEEEDDEDDDDDNGGPAPPGPRWVPPRPRPTRRPEPDPDPGPERELLRDQ